MSFTKFIGKQLILLFTIGILAPSNAATIYVDLAATAGSNNGSSWANAYVDLQDALAASVAGDEIWVAQGTYYPTATFTQSITFQIKSGVKVYGGFDGTEVSSHQRDYIANQTILSGDLGQDGATGNNSYTVVYLLAANNQTLLDGFIVEHGNAADPAGSNPAPSRSGGGLYNDGFVTPSNPTVRNCTFRNNLAAVYGGAYYNNGDCTSIIENCTFENNTSFAGGAMYNAGSLLKDCSPTLTKCSFKDNYGTAAAGAVYNDGNIGTSSPIFISCNFIHNHTDSSQVTYSGAVYNFGKSGVCNPKFYNCLFDANYTFAGGAVYNLGQLGTCNPDFVNCTFYENVAVFNGGALYANAGGPSSGTCNMNVYNCIFKDNVAGLNGGDIFRNNYGSITINNSIVDLVDCNALNTGSGPMIVCTAVQFSTDPLFEDAPNGDFTLQSISPAIDAGDNTQVTAGGITIDLNCNGRFYNTTADIGATEYQGALPIELASFNAYFDGKEVLLDWTTFYEQDNDFFTVERSGDGSTWTEIAQVAGAGNSIHARYYSASDENPLPGINYYRLKQTDFNKQSSWSEVRVVKVVEARISIYPNPVAQSAHIALGSFEEELITVEIRHIDGRLIYSQKQQVDRNVQVVSVDDLSFLHAGTYVLTVLSENIKQQSLIFSKIDR